MFLRAVVLPFVLIALAASGLAWQVAQLVADVHMLDETNHTMLRAHELQRMLEDQEMGFRAYLLTEDRSFLGPLERSHPEAALEDLERLTSDDAEELAWVRALRGRYADWNRTATEALTAPGPARALPAMRSRKATMDEMHALGAKIIAREDEQRTDRLAASQRATERTIWTAGGLVACFLLVSWTVSRRQVYTIAALIEREQDARRAAEGALRVKDEFLGTLSHELRTPLTPILGWVSMLRAKQLDSRASARALEVIERNTRVEIQIVDDVLDVSRIVSGKLAMAPQVMDLVAVVRDAIETVRFAAAGKGITIDAAYAQPALPMIGDPGRLLQVAWNLVGNAIKFTPAGGRVEVRVDLIDSSARLRVTDTGQGLAADSLAHVFDRFWQADAGSKRAFGGLGLGLSISKHLVEAHGGTIDVASAGAGRGATFTVALPVMAVVPPCEGAHAEALSCARLRLDGIRVLIVDDEPSALEVLSTLLRAHGAVVHEARSGPRALQLLDCTAVDVVISDIAMPGMDGYQLIARIRASPEERRRHVASVAISAYAAPQDVRRALGSGFQMHLAKPVSPANLVGAVLDLAHRPAPV